MATTARPRSRPRIVIRIALAIAGVLFLIGALVFVPLAAYALLSPFSGVPVPATCEGGTAVPSPGPVAVDGYGDGTPIAADGPATVVVVPGPDGRTAGGSLHLLAGADVVFSVPVASRAVAAGIADGRAYLFDDKIGYFLDAATGRPVLRTFTVDNYRGLYMADGVEHVQTTFEVAFVGAPGPPFQAVGMPFGAVVDGCLVAAVG